jgi:hypothetical protein
MLSEYPLVAEEHDSVQLPNLSALCCAVIGYIRWSDQNNC